MFFLFFLRTLPQLGVCGCKIGDVMTVSPGARVEGVKDYGWHQSSLAWRHSGRQLGAWLRWNEVIAVM